LPCKYVICEGGNLVLERWTGAVSYEELLAHKTGQLRDRSINPGASVLSDCRAATFAVSDGQIGEVSAADGQPDRTTTVRRYALVVNSDVYDRAQFFSKRVSEHGVTAIVFSSFDIACTWLGVDPKSTLKLMRESHD
jgi:hypothetical protein